MPYGCSYGVWKFLPLDQQADVLDPCDAPYNRPAQIQFAASVLQRFEMVEEDQLGRALRAEPAAGKQVVTSISCPNHNGCGTCWFHATRSTRWD